MAMYYLLKNKRKYILKIKKKKKDVARTTALLSLVFHSNNVDQYLTSTPHSSTDSGKRCQDTATSVKMKSA